MRNKNFRMSIRPPLTTALWVQKYDTDKGETSYGFNRARAIEGLPATRDPPGRPHAGGEETADHHRRSGQRDIAGEDTAGADVPHSK